MPTQHARSPAHITPHSTHLVTRQHFAHSRRRRRRNSSALCRRRHAVVVRALVAAQHTVAYVHKSIANNIRVSRTPRTSLTYCMTCRRTACRRRTSTPGSTHTANTRASRTRCAVEGSKAFDASRHTTQQKKTINNAPWGTLSPLQIHRNRSKPAWSTQDTCS
jgi:hypothetical protein